MSILSEFREFAVKGNVIDLAVGVIIGAAFGKIVTSLTEDLLNPILGAVTGGLDFSSHYINLSSTQYESYEAAKKAGAAVLGYGSFITALIQFLIMAFIIFLMVKSINRMRAERGAVTPAAAAAPPPSEVYLQEIRDLLKSQQGVPPKV